MSEPWSTAAVTPHEPSGASPSSEAPLTPRGLLEQMRELLASVSSALAGGGAALPPSEATGAPGSGVAAGPPDAP